MMSWSAIKAEGKDEDAGTFVVMAFDFLSNCYAYCSPAAQKVAGHLSAGQEEYWMHVLL